MFSKRDIIWISLIVVLVLSMVYILTGSEYLFGSTTDYINQHIVFADYFRELFYETGNLFPDFMPHIGSGQNIYYASYYGLLNPLVMISYLVPFVSMVNYFMILSILLLISSGVLFYIYLKSHDYSRFTSFIGSFLLITSSPIFFHAHRHIMFMNYIPFLIIGLFGVDKFLEKRDIKLLVFSLVMMIFTSYYYSVGGFICLIVYMFYRYSKLNEFSFIDFFKTCLRICVPYILSIMIGMVLLLPTIYTLINGRMDSNVSVSFSDMLVINELPLYAHYSMGMSLISLIALIYLVVFKKLEDKVIGVFLLFINFFPIFNYVLNGFMYINYKSLIPFIPLLILVTMIFIKDIIKYRITKWIVIPIVILTQLGICIGISYSDSLITREFYNNNYDDVISVNEYLKSLDDSYYRVNNIVNTHANMNFSGGAFIGTIYSSTSNNNYYNLYTNVLENNLTHRNMFMLSGSSNIISQILLGEKYIISSYNIENYELVDKVNGQYVSENIYALPIAYATNSYININDYNELDTYSKMVNLIGNVVSSDDTNTDLVTLNTLEYEIVKEENIEVEYIDDKMLVNASSNNYLKMEVDSDNYLVVSFKVKNKSSDINIVVNRINNKLTSNEWKYYNNNELFTYVVKGDINLFFNSGKYELSDFVIYEIEEEMLESGVIPMDISEFSGDNLNGSISLEDDSMMVLSIPYDDGFVVKVDDVVVDYEMVNDGLIGFYVDKGNHNIDIEFVAPYKNISLVISSVGVIMFLLFIIYSKRSKLWVS